jgi:outer membrane protein OmpA-like peptidoglycan-associated protein/tetratricopeptide (TPR) repeat protein
MLNHLILTLLISLLSFLNPMDLSAQFDKANNLYQAKRYAAAIPQFESGLKVKDNLVAKSRLAYCYRMLNQMEKAETIYADVVSNEKARSETYLYYAETLMSNSKYKEAKNWFQKYYVLEPTDSMALRRAEACDKVPLIQPYIKDLKVEEFGYNSEADDNSPVLGKDGLVFTSDRATGRALLKEKSDWTGRDFLKLWVSKFDEEKGTFTEPESYSGKLNELNKNTTSASFTENWEQIFFSRNGDIISKKNEVTIQLYEAERSGGKWKNERKLDFCNDEQNYMHPSISADGNTIFYAANAGGQGGMDILMAHKTKNGWGKTKNLGSVVNTSNHEAFPYFHKDGRLFFCSKGHPGFGGFDVFVTKFDTINGTWKTPINLGRPINSSLDDIGFYLTKNDSLGCFTSGRNGGDDDIYLFWLGEQKNVKKVLAPNAPEIKESTTTETEILKEEAPEIPYKNPHINEAPILVGVQITKPTNSTQETKRTETKPNNIFVEKELPTKAKTNLLPKVEPSKEAVKDLVQTLPDLDRILQDSAAIANNVFQLIGIHYDNIEATDISADSYPEIAMLSNLLERHQNAIIEIRSHTESLGVDKQNFTISKKRAAKIKKLLVKKGISSKRIKTMGFGESNLLNDCSNAIECPQDKHLENRRTEIVLIKKF